jgi:hypothetical protein
MADKIAAMQEAALVQTAGIPGYPCYRTVEETFATAELLTRLAEYLVDNYDTDPDVTWMLDHHEIHMMLHVNPDGRKQAETGLSWRKNTNQNYCGAASNYRGADLNRNFEFKWNGQSGSSGDPCSLVYRGPYPASEPETQAIQNYIRSQFPDQRGPNDTDPAPLDTTGIYLDMHSHGREVLYQSRWLNDAVEPVPNVTELITLARKVGYFNGHSVYGTTPDGTTKLFGYGEMGIPAYTIELGTVKILVKILPIANNSPMCYIDDRKKKVFFQDNNGKE